MSIRSALWPIMEKSAEFPAPSSGVSHSENSFAMPARSAVGSFFQSAQRTRAIWCRTLAPSSVSGIAGSPVSARIPVLVAMVCEPLDSGVASIVIAARQKLLWRGMPLRKAVSPARRKQVKFTPPEPTRVAEILKRLEATYGGATCALTHRTAWELLVATILSAQCTDARVNMVTPVIFKKYPTPQDFARLKPEELEPDIRSTGFFRNKSKSIVGASKKIVETYGGKVPETMEELLEVPGAARKTANVVLGSWFKKAAGVVVDTHVHRISRRLELTDRDDPKNIEQDLMQV